MKLSALKVDVDKIESGQWIGDIPEMGGLRLKVRGIQNAQYRRMQSRLNEAVPRAKRPGGRIDPDEQDRIVNTCLAATVLIDWEGLENEDGSALPYSREQATEMLKDPVYRRFRDAVIYAATLVGDGEAEVQKADEGNSPST